PSLCRGLTVAENTRLSAGRRRFVATRAPWRACTRAEAIAATLAQMGLAGRAGDLAGTLSHGEKQWLEIAMLLVDDPTLLLLDEPAAGMTRPEKERTIALIEGIVARSSSCVRLIEHDMEFVRKVARRSNSVTVLDEGTVPSR